MPFFQWWYILDNQAFSHHISPAVLKAARAVSSRSILRMFTGLTSACKISMAVVAPGLDSLHEKRTSNFSLIFHREWRGGQDKALAHSLAGDAASLDLWPAPSRSPYVVLFICYIVGCGRAPNTCPICVIHGGLSSACTYADIRD